ncbi:MULTISPECIES: helix-turn-helix domain-containing protein [Myxococcus]|uniref:helix-turn-helix domain-containing protein n=1 Tax=Myxococcus TaxID=32 RepID=UPI001144341D|nr:MULTISPECIES: helix-turn-helix domain-containing protein [Myxococcus]
MTDCSQAPEVAVPPPEPKAKQKRVRRQPVPLENLPAGLWTVRDCALYLGKSDDWVYRRSADGTLPVRKHGADNRYHRDEIVEWARRLEERD